MKAYHNDPRIKETYLNRVQAHALADEIVHGIYWEQGKGCAVGCTIHGDEHLKYETELGIPEWLARLEDCIFEELPNKEAKLFPAQFLDSIPVGANLDPVKTKFCLFLLDENLERVKNLELNIEVKTQVIQAIEQVKEALIIQDDKKLEVALSVAESAHSAAMSAARSAAESAWSAAWSARSATVSATWSGTWIRYKDKLLELLREAELDKENGDE